MPREATELGGRNRRQIDWINEFAAGYNWTSVEERALRRSSFLSSLRELPPTIADS